MRETRISRDFTELRHRKLHTQGSNDYDCRSRTSQKRTRSAEIREQLGYPIIDTDVHTQEFPQFSWII